MQAIEDDRQEFLELRHEEIETLAKIVMDTIIEEMTVNMYPNQPWQKGNNPKTAVHEFLKNSQRFLIDYQIQNKLMITVTNDGYLKCIG